MKLVIREAALADLEAICDWIAKDSPANARSVAERILDAAENKIVHFPFIGRTGQMPGTREWIMRGLPYIIVYRVERNSVTILGIFHGARMR